MPRHLSTTSSAMSTSSLVHNQDADIDDLEQEGSGRGGKDIGSLLLLFSILGVVY